MAAEDDNPRPRRTNADLYDVLMDVRDDVQSLLQDRRESKRQAADFEKRLRDDREDIITLKNDMQAVKSTVSGWGKAMWGLISGLIITVVGAIVAYGVLAK